VLLAATVEADAAGWGLDRPMGDRVSVCVGALGLGPGGDEAAERGAALTRVSELKSAGDRVPTDTAMPGGSGPLAAHGAVAAVPGTPTLA